MAAQGALAKEIVTRFHSASAAEHAEREFTAQFRDKQLPTDLAQFTLVAPEGMLIGQVLKEVGLTTSTSEAIRLIRSGAVRVDGDRVEDEKRKVAAGTNHLYQVGKHRAAKVTITR